MLYKIVLEESVIHKDLPKLSHPIKLRVFQEIKDKLSEHPLIFGKPLRNILKNKRSLRIGDYRVLYAVEKDIVYIANIRHRKDVYD